MAFLMVFINVLTHQLQPSHISQVKNKLQLKIEEQEMHNRMNDNQNHEATDETNGKEVTPKDDRLEQILNEVSFSYLRMTLLTSLLQGCCG